MPTDSTAAHPRAERIPRPHPNEIVENRVARALERPGFLVDLRRCIGCHACSVACKTAHDIPLGEFPLRVRWLPRPEGDGYAFVPVFSESLCNTDPESTDVGLDPACVRACPTDALAFGDAGDPASSVALGAQSDVRLLSGPDAHDLKKDVLYRALPMWVGEKLNAGAALDPRDEDPIYEQR